MEEEAGMRARCVVGWGLFVFAVVAPWGLAPARAQEAAANPNWDLKLGFSYLATSGNTDTSSAGFDARFIRDWRLWGLEATSAAVRATRNDRKTAESYNVQARGRRRIRDGTEMTFGVRGERNRFAGIDARTILDTSLLRPLFRLSRFSWLSRWKIQSLTGISWTREDPRGRRRRRDSFGGLFQLQTNGKLSPTSELTAQATWYPNLERRKNYRLHGQASLQSQLNRHLGLLLACDVKYDNEPVRGFRRLDTSTTVSLVVQLGRKARA
jgi:putative salt-induced outer membrane protein YdiY